MVEFQSFSASLVNASSALSSIENQEVKGESNVNHVIAEISAELQRERQKNAELLEKISLLEAQIQQRDNQSLSTHEQGPAETNLKKFKRQKTQVLAETENAIKIETDSEKKKVTKCLTLVNWMSRNETQISQCSAGCDDTDDSDNEDDIHNREEDIHIGIVNVSDHHKCGVSEPTQETKEELNGDYKAVSENVIGFRSGTKCHTRTLNISNAKKPPKVAFCPREVKSIIESEVLKQGNAHSHTIRKIIVFASLGIRHGCEDMYELDFNHFNILRKGEPYESPANPGEHVVYENPRYPRKVFYSNRENPKLCPVQILEEEKVMRPSDSSCPSCLFLCIKYGGRTRNLPQNEYVRQRMGRNKLKSFGPLICRTAMLVHIRSGSFFFKALGITLLFMAGFPDDLVKRETKYRNLDLLQKYYRTDEEAQGEELFLQHPIITSDAASPSSHHFTGRTFQTKPKAKKQTKPQLQTTQTHKPSMVLQRPSNAHLNSGPLTQFGQMGFASVHTHAMTSFQSISSQPQTPPLHNNSLSLSINSAISNSVSNLNNVSYHHMFPNQPTNGFVPQAVMFWPHQNTFPQPHYASPYRGYTYRSFPSPGGYISIHPQPYNCASQVPRSLSVSPKHEEGDRVRCLPLKEAENDHTDSNSSSTEPLED